MLPTVDTIVVEITQQVIEAPLSETATTIPIKITVRKKPVPVPPPPDDFYNLKTLGAKGDGVTDDLGAINTALAKCRADKKKLYVPTGKYVHSAPFYVDSQIVYGDGDTSEFIAKNPLNSVIYLTGVGPVLKSIKHVVNVAGQTRQFAGPQSSVAAWLCTAFLLDSVTIEGATAIGLLCYGAKGTSSIPGVVQNCRVSGSLADTIHMNNGCEFLTIQNNYCRNGGDDCIAVVSDVASGKIGKNILIRYNDVGFNTWGRGITVVGGESIDISDNIVAKTNAAGILIYAEDSYKTYAASNCTVRRNTITDACQNTNLWHPALLIGGRSGYVTTNVMAEANNIVRPMFDGIRVDPYVSGITLKQNTITGVLAGRQSINISAAAKPFVVVL